MVPYETGTWGSGPFAPSSGPRRCAMVGDVACPKAWTLVSLNIRKQRRDPSPGFIGGVECSTVKHSIYYIKYNMYLYMSFISATVLIP